MVRRILASLAFTLCAGLAVAQTTGDHIDPYFGDWHASTPRTTRGSLAQRDIFTRGDPQNPTRKAAVLRYINSYTYATLAPNASTRATHLEGEQEIYFIQSGRGRATAAGQSADLYRNVAILMPANLEFTLSNTGDQPLAMYVINEPTPRGFRPNSTMVVRDENKIPITSSDGLWAHIVKTLFVTADGLATLESVLTVTLDPLTIGKPHLVDHDDMRKHGPLWTAPVLRLWEMHCGGKLRAWRFTIFPTTRLLTPTSTKTKTLKSGFSTSLVTIRMNPDRRPGS